MISQMFLTGVDEVLSLVKLLKVLLLFPKP